MVLAVNKEFTFMRQPLSNPTMGDFRRGRFQMDRRVKISTVGALFAALTGSTLLATPAFALEPKPVYVVAANSAATVTQILASGDSVAGSAKWQGIPDGMGAVKNPNGTISVFVNHELATSDPFVAKTERAYGGYGATISKVTTNAAGTAVTKVEDAIKKVAFFDYEAGTHGSEAVAPVGAPDADSYGSPNHTSNLNRFCAATLVETGGLSVASTGYVGKTQTVKTLITAQYWVEINGKMKRINAKRYVTDTVNLWQNSAGKWGTKKVKRNITFGTTAPIFLTGEEGGDESRIFGLNTATGELVQLPALGLGAVENVSVAPKTGTTTVAMIGEDGEVADSQLFMYKGTKKTTGTWYERAGLTNGANHVANISSLVNVTTVLPSATSVAANAAITNDVIARATLDRKVVSSAVRGGDTRKSTSTLFAIANGIATVTAANSFIAGEVVSIAGLTAGAATGVDVSEVKLLSASSSAYTFATDGENVTSGANIEIVATPAANRVLVTTGSVHNLVEGDKVSITFAGGEISGTHVVTGVPSTTKFTVDTAGTTASTFTVTADSRVNRLLDVAFTKVNTSQSGLAQAASAKALGTEFSRVEDGHFNPMNRNEYFFVTTQSDSDGTGWTGAATGTGATVNSPAVKEASTPTRDGGAVWKLTFVDVRKPELGATLDLVLNGSEAPVGSNLKLNKLDNITISDDGTVAFLQEDPGGNDQVARVLAVRLSDRKLVSVATFDTDMFGVAGDADNANAQLTNDEEASGIFDATKLFGGSGLTFMFNAQIHPVSTLGGLNSSSNGLSFASDPLKATATALLRPDLRTNAVELAVSAVSVADEASSGTTVVYNRDMTLTVANTDNVAANDVINVVGLTRAHNGTYVVKSVTATTVVVSLYSGKSASISSSRYAGAAIVGAGRMFVSNPDEDMAIKDAIIEGGALYTLKITSLTALFADLT
jgi:hypothetical protein